MQTCGAKTRSGEPCKQRAMANGRCRMHGGKSLSGPASGTYVTGRHSKYLPSRLLERYDQALADPQLLELREEVALLDARLSDLLHRVDHGESGALWSKLAQTFDDFSTAMRQGDQDELRYQLTALSDLIQRGQSDYSAWHEIQAIVEQRRKLVESERKRLVEMQSMMTAEQATLLLGYVVDAVRRHVHDRSTLAAISDDFSRVLGTALPAGPARRD